MSAEHSSPSGHAGHRSPLLHLILGSRGSALARAQAEMVEKALRSEWPAIAIETKIIKTSGDDNAGKGNDPPDKRAGRKGMFTAEIERALLLGEIDVAVHSAKDLPSDVNAGAEIGGVLTRAPMEDVLITRTSGGFESLPHNAVVATGSVRREHQLQAKRADLRVVNLKGNVPTRLRRFVESNWDAIVLARAGLERLGFQAGGERIVFEGTKLWTELLSLENFIPAGGQGIIALQVRSDDESTKELAGRVNHRETLLCLRAEREFLRLLAGDCNSPVGVLATIEGEAMQLRAEVFEPETRARRSGKVLGEMEAPEALAAELIKQIG